VMRDDASWARETRVFRIYEQTCFDAARDDSGAGYGCCISVGIPIGAGHFDDDSTLLSGFRRGKLRACAAVWQFQIQLEPRQNCELKQSFKKNARRGLSVICATPANKQTFQAAPKRFLCCVCISLQ
jgi:hypothetical protein